MSSKNQKKLSNIDLDSLFLSPDSSINSKLYPDGNSLYLKVLKNGKKYWHVQYTFEGKTSFTSVGVYPKVSLKKARELCEEIHKKIDNGVHPLAEKRRAKEKQLQQQKEEKETFRKVAERWNNIRKNKVTKDTYQKSWRQLEMHVLPIIGNKNIHDIKNQELTNLFCNIATKSGQKEGETITYLAYMKLPSLCKQIFDQAIFDEIYSKKNPLDAVKKALPNHKHKNSKRIDTTDASLSKFLYVLDNYQGQRTKLAIWFLLYTAQRQIAIRRARWKDFDLTNKIWNRQPEKKDNINVILRLPLPDQAISILEELREETYQNNPNNLIFPASHKNASESKSISAGTITGAIKRMGFKMVGHGIRGLVSTSLNDLDFDDRLIEKQLGHTLKGVEKAYNSAQYFERRKNMIQLWADHLDELKNLTEQDLTINEDDVWIEYRKKLELLYFEENSNHPVKTYRELAKKSIAERILKGDNPLTIDEFVLKIAKNEHKDFFAEITPSVNEEIKQLKIKHKEYAEKYPDQFPATPTLESIRALRDQLAAEAIFGWKSR